MANAKIQVLIGSQAPGLKVNNPDPSTGVLIGITKTKGDTTNVTIEVTFVLTNLLGNSPISFLIQKGDLGVTAVALYNFNSERSLVASFINNGKGSTDGKNSASYSVGAGSLVAGGPLSDPFQDLRAWFGRFTILSGATRVEVDGWIPVSRTIRCWGFLS